MKAAESRRVPLSGRALEIALGLEKIKQSDYVFRGQKICKPLSNQAMLKLLERMGRTDITMHGFRSSFCDWASECINFPRDVCEMALAHTISNKAEAAYRRGDLFEKRRVLMKECVRHCVKDQRAPPSLNLLMFYVNFTQNDSRLG